LLNTDFVLIHYNLGSYRTILDFDLVEQIYNQSFHGVSVKLVVSHFWELEKNCNSRNIQILLEAKLVDSHLLLSSIF
jgi:hypothetical protein